MDDLKFILKEFQNSKMGIDVLSYVVENFFLVILRLRIFFIYDIFQKIDF